MKHIIPTEKDIYHRYKRRFRKHGLTVQRINYYADDPFSVFWIFDINDKRRFRGVTTPHSDSLWALGELLPDLGEPNPEQQYLASGGGTISWERLPQSPA